MVPQPGTTSNLSDEFLADDIQTNKSKNDESGAIHRADIEEFLNSITELNEHLEKAIPDFEELAP